MQVTRHRAGQPWRARGREKLSRIVRETEPPTDSLPRITDRERTDSDDACDAMVGEVLDLAGSIGAILMASGTPATAELDAIVTAPHPYKRWVATLAWGALAFATAGTLGAHLLACVQRAQRHGDRPRQPAAQPARGCRSSSNMRSAARSPPRVRSCFLPGFRWWARSVDVTTGARSPLRVVSSSWS